MPGLQIFKYIYIYIRVGLCIRNAKSAQYHKDRAANIEFRLPQNSATVCFISIESSGGMMKWNRLMKQTVAEF